MANLHTKNEYQKVSSTQLSGLYPGHPGKHGPPHINSPYITKQCGQIQRGTFQKRLPSVGDLNSKVKDCLNEIWDDYSYRPGLYKR